MRSSLHKSQKSHHLHVVQKSIDESTFIVFDIETTGGNPTNNGITEICALKVREGKVLDTFYSLCNPQIPIPPIVRKMTGINNAMVRNAPTIDAIMPQFVEFIGDSVLVSHNTIGDMKFLKHYSHQTIGHAIENFYLCTHLLVERLVPESKNKSLKGLAQFFQFVAKGSVHRADADAHLTLDLFNILTTRLREKKINIVADAIRLQGDIDSGMRLGWSVHHSEIAKIPTTPGVVQLFDREGRLHYLTAAENMQREVRNLSRYEQLPRPLLRIVINTAKVESKTHEHFFAALLEEGKSLSRIPRLLSPTQLHQRYLPTVNLMVPPGSKQMHLQMGEVTQGVFAAFAPIGDRKEMGKILAEVTKACSGEPGKILACPKMYRKTLTDFFSGKLAAKTSSSFVAMFASRVLNFVSLRRRLLHRTIDQLRLIKIPTLVSVLESRGALLVQTGKDHSYDVFTINRGRLHKMGAWKGSIEDFRKNRAWMRRLLRKLKSPWSSKKILLSRADALQASRIVWFTRFHTQAPKSSFISLEIIESHALRTPPKPTQIEAPITN